MDNDYYSIDAILAENQKLQCMFFIDVPDLGYLDGGNEKDIKANTKLLLPYWLAPTLSLQDWVEVAIPVPYSTRVKKALEANPRNVKLSTLVGDRGTWYGFGKMIVDLLQEPQNTELGEVLTNTFTARLLNLMDQAQHFGGAAASVGSGGSSALGSGGSAGDGGGEFREGLEATERELFALAQDSARRTKEWHENVRKGR